MIEIKTSQIKQLVNAQLEKIAREEQVYLKPYIDEKKIMETETALLTLEELLEESDIPAIIQSNERCYSFDPVLRHVFKFDDVLLNYHDKAFRISVIPTYSIDVYRFHLPLANAMSPYAPDFYFLVHINHESLEAEIKDGTVECQLVGFYTHQDVIDLGTQSGLNNLVMHGRHLLSLEELSFELESYPQDKDWQYILPRSPYILAEKIQSWSEWVADEGNVHLPYLPLEDYACLLDSQIRSPQNNLCIEYLKRLHPISLGMRALSSANRQSILESQGYKGERLKAMMSEWEIETQLPTPGKQDLQRLVDYMETHLVNIIWNSKDSDVWKSALDAYYRYVIFRDPERLILEVVMNHLISNEVENKGQQALNWKIYFNQCIVWFFQSSSSIQSLYPERMKAYEQTEEALILECVDKLFSLKANTNEVPYKAMIETVLNLPGIGQIEDGYNNIHFATGVLSLLFPKDFATLSPPIEEALRRLDMPQFQRFYGIRSLNSSSAHDMLKAFNTLTLQLNQRFDHPFLTPRKIDMILFAVRAWGAKGLMERFRQKNYLEDDNYQALKALDVQPIVDDFINRIVAEPTPEMNETVLKHYRQVIDSYQNDPLIIKLGMKDINSIDSK